MQTSHILPIGLALALSCACSSPTTPAAAPDTAASGDAATSFADAKLDIAIADSTAADNSGSETTATDASGADSPGKETTNDAGPTDAQAADTPAPADSAASDGKVSDATATDLTGADVSSSDTGAGETSGGETSVGEVVATDTSAADTAKDGTATQPIGKIWACKANAPGYASCFTQAFVQCLQPGATCKAVSEFSPAVDTFTTTWSNGSVLKCVTTTTGTEGTISCTGHGPDGKACLQYTQKFKDEMPAGTMVTGPNGSHSLAYDASFKVTVTCGDGSKESYNKSEDLCYPLQSGVCEENIGGGGWGARAFATKSLR